MRMNRKEYKLLVENWRRLINENESQLYPPTKMDFGSDRMDPQRLHALKSAPQAFVEYDGSKMFSSEEDFVQKMLSDLSENLKHSASTPSYRGHAEEELENAFNALFNGVLPQSDPYGMGKELKEGDITLTKTGYEFKDLDSLREDLESRDPNLKGVIAELYNIPSNWSYYSIFASVAFN